MNISQEINAGYDKVSQQEEYKYDVLVSEQIAVDLVKLYHSHKWTDVTLAVKDRRFKVHRLILSTRCEYFKKLFEEEPNKVLFELDSSFTPEVFELVLEYIYSGNMVVNRKISDEVTEISLKLGLVELTKDLAGFSGTKLTVENVLQELQRYYGKNNKAAFEHCLRFLDHNITKVGTGNMQLLTMPFEIMVEIVKRQTLGLEEAEVLNLIISWKKEQELNSDAETVKRQATQLAQHLKLHLIQPDAYFSVLKPTGFFTTEVLWDTLAEMINSNRRFPPRDDDSEPKYRPRKPGPKSLKTRRKGHPLAFPSFPIAILGMEASGKTTIIYKLKLGEVVTTIPTVGFNLEEVQYKSSRFVFTDCGYKVRNNWMDLVSPKTAALMWIIDSNNREVDLNAEGAYIREIFEKFGNPEMPLLVVANKQDLPNAQSVAEIAEKLGLHSLRIPHWFIQAACATTGDGLYEGLDWINRILSPDDYD